MASKKQIEDLALFGGQSAFNNMLHVGRPNIGNRARLLERINDLLDRRWLSNNGPYVQELEKRIAQAVGVKNCIAMCNGTIALEIAIKAIGLTGEVIIPSFTFIATAHALQWQEITPVFCDIDFLSHHIDTKKVEKLITPRTTGIIGVHVWGQPCNIEVLTEISNKYDLKLMFDAAHAFGCSYKGQMIGKFGNAEVFSFHATKFINSFEGGAVVTNDDALAAKIRLMTNFGFVGYDQVDYIGTNGKMSEVSAAMGITSLESLEEFIAINYRNYMQYQRELSKIPGIKILTFNEVEKCNYQYIVLEIDESITQINRDQFVEILWAENILARRYFYPGCHRMEPYRSQNPDAGLMLPETEKLGNRVLILPTGSTIGVEEISDICQIIQLVIQHRKEVSGRFQESTSMRIKVIV